MKPPATLEEERTSSSSSSSAVPALGIFPFPPARDSPRSPPSPTTSASFGLSGSREPSNKEKMDATNAFFFGHHHQQVVALMQRKFQNLLDYDKTKNRKILHVDW